MEEGIELLLEGSEVMKICLLTRFLDFRNAGIGRVSLEVLKGLRERGHEVHTVSDGSSLYSYFYYTMLRVPLTLPRNFDIYHAITPMEAIWVPKDRTVVNFNDLIPITHPERAGAGLGSSQWKLAVGRRYFEFACRVASRAKIITCISEQTKRDVVKYLRVPEEKVRVVRLGISEDLEPKPKRDSTFRIGCLGQLDRRKRVDLLIKAFRKSNLEGELAIAGMGVDEPMLRKLADGDGRIRFLGFVPDEELAGFYNSADVLIFPSAIQGWGLCEVEAMACGRPVVVLEDAIIPWEVKSRCIIVEDLSIVLNNPDYFRNLTDHVDYEGNYLFAKGHSWSKTIETYLALYQEITGG